MTTTTTVVAAVEPGPLTADVVATARRLAGAMAAEPVALWVRPGTDPSPVAPAVAISLIQRTGDPASEIAAELARSDVVAAVVGLRTVPAGPRPAGHVTQRLLAESDTPIVVVPPEIPDPAASGPVLVPLEGGRRPGDTLATLLASLQADGNDIIPMHVFDRTTTPPFWDGWHDRDLWRREFTRRWAPTGSDPAVIRAGAVAQEILAEAERRGAQLIALEWSRNLASPHAPVVRHLLSNTRIPLLLVPLPE